MESWNLKALWLDLIVTITVSGNCFQNSIMHLKSEQNTVNLAHLLLGDNLISHSSELKLQSCQCPPWMYWCISLYNCTQLAFVGLISRASGSVIKSISTLMNGRSSGRAGGVLRYSAENMSIEKQWITKWIWAPLIPQYKSILFMEDFRFGIPVACKLCELAMWKSELYQRHGGGFFD